MLVRPAGYLANRSLINLARDFNLSKKASELNISILREKNVLGDDARVSFFLIRGECFLKFFIEEKDFVYCNAVEGLLKALDLET